MFLIKFTFIDGVDIIENCHEYYVKKEKIDKIIYNPSFDYKHFKFK